MEDQDLYNELSTVPSSMASEVTFTITISFTHPYTDSKRHVHRDNSSEVRMSGRSSASGAAEFR